MPNEESPPSGSKNEFLTPQSISFPVVLGVITGFQAAKAPTPFVIGLGVLGALAILGYEIYQAEIPKNPGERKKWWAARLLIWLFNTVVVIGSVIYLGGH